MIKRFSVVAFSFVVFCFLFATIAQAAWYQVKPVKVVSFPNGKIELHVDPGTGETAFAGTVRVQFNTELDPGSKSMYATILTAISLGSELKVQCDVVPTWSPVEYTGGVNLVVP